MEELKAAVMEQEAPLELESLPKRIMVAGVGNMFMRDDGFGGEVIKKMENRIFPRGVEVKDFGTGGLKLAYDLMNGYDGLILIDAAQRGDKPGTLYVIEPREEEISANLEEGGPIDPHGGDPATVLRFIKSVGSWPGRVVIVACEPESVEEFQIGLSEPVSASLDQAVSLVEEYVNEMRSSI